jgi:uncharacterized protein (DUF302 family)
MKHPLVAVKSPFSVNETAERLEKLLTSRGIRIFARIDHAAAARESGLELQDEIVIVFGDPKVGTALMQECPAIGIELPLKILIWQENETYVAYRDPKHYLEEYSLVKNALILEKMSDLMHTLAKEITC